VLAAWFSDFLIPWIFQEIAFGLGTVKYDLPPRKVWGKNSGTVPLPGGTGPPPGAGQISPPVSPLRISGYHYSADHPGVDLGIQRGQAIYAAHDGEVIYTAEGFTDYGHQIVLAGGDWWTRYAHLARLGVSRGDRVRAQTVIAAGNSTGNSSGDHLHFEVKFRGQYIDPLGVLAGI
jgi:murein DD-endopeptidase MepM/ murein hydrolase activator NlpD